MSVIAFAVPDLNPCIFALIVSVGALRDEDERASERDTPTYRTEAKREREREHAKVCRMGYAHVHSAATEIAAQSAVRGHALFDARASERTFTGPTNKLRSVADPLFTLSDFNSCKHRIYKQSDPPTNAVLCKMHAYAFPTGANS